MIHGSEEIASAAASESLFHPTVITKCNQSIRVDLHNQPRREEMNHAINKTTIRFANQHSSIEWEQSVN